jgi:hypothetical protein
MHGGRKAPLQARAHANALHGTARDPVDDAGSLNHHQRQSFTGTGGSLFAALPTKVVTGTGDSLCTRYGIWSANGASSWVKTIASHSKTRLKCATTWYCHCTLSHARVSNNTQQAKGSA